MGGRSMEEWEQAFGADLRPHRIPAGLPDAPMPPSGLDRLPPGARAALSAGIGRYGPEDLLILPRAARHAGLLRRRLVYTPPCVLGVGARAGALGALAPPHPAIPALGPCAESAPIR